VAWSAAASMFATAALIARVLHLRAESGRYSPVSA